MEERKQRIMRKYLRERTHLAQSDVMVPVDAPEDEAVVDSERFKQPQVDLQRQEPGAPMPPPTPRRPRPPAEDRNWLLAVDPLLEDPYADPFSPTDPAETPKKQEDWTTWGAERDSPSFGGVQRDSWYDRRSQGTAAEQTQRYDPRAFSSEGNQPGFQQQEPVTGGFPGVFGRQQTGSSAYTSGALDLSRDKIFNSTLNQGRLKSPFPRDSAQSEDRSFGSGSRMKSQGYIPYKSPYQTQREQQQQQWGGRNQPGQEYKKQDSFQKWKDKNPTPFDPTRDDAYIDEPMPKSGR